VLWQYAWTGDAVAASVRSRVWLSSLQGYHLGPIHLSPEFALRLLAYAPLTLLASVGTPAALRSPDPLRRFAALLFWLGAAMLSVSGGVHLARYSIFLMPALCLLAGMGWDAPRIERPMSRRSAAAVAVVWLAGVFAWETAQRYAFASADMLRAVVDAPAQRSSRTSQLLDALGAPADGVISVAVVEVQMRYFLDDRVVVRSLDGRTDGEFLAFVRDGLADDLGYLRARAVDYLLEFPARSGAGGWSLSELLALPPDGGLERGGVRFRRLGDSDAVHVTFPGTTGIFR
jgi:hypothetical protein